MKPWIILRTSTGNTLPLSRSLNEAGYEAWTPERTLRRYVRANTPSGKRAIESQIPILPTFVFAQEQFLADLVTIANSDRTAHPTFSVFNVDGRVPQIHEAEIAGLRREEAEAAATIKAMHEAESRAAAEKIRIAAIKSASARRRAEQELERDRRAALRRSPIALQDGAEVEVADMPALVGIRGVFERADGPYAHVRFGTRSWKIEGWRVCPAPLNDNAALRSTAA
ncbi:hypothetical protein PX554_13725 [Sphingomonas sp. H39-1-10]|uniref:hypothetical protein n=1 Tax=Sphingomonas pollutisoli TaxID=3030829 RepID=UPI0023B8AA14|nr:hypothetical protein [Sphingomonas pollutisoli]MDF0489195.1 hypothetical protein [Sphingomonas pollutisoli]